MADVNKEKRDNNNNLTKGNSKRNSSKRKGPASATTGSSSVPAPDVVVTGEESSILKFLNDIRSSQKVCDSKVDGLLDRIKSWKKAITSRMNTRETMISVITSS